MRWVCVLICVGLTLAIHIAERMMLPRMKYERNVVFEAVSVEKALVSGLACFDSLPKSSRPCFAATMMMHGGSAEKMRQLDGKTAMQIAAKARNSEPTSGIPESVAICRAAQINDESALRQSVAQIIQMAFEKPDSPPEEAPPAERK